MTLLTQDPIKFLMVSIGSHYFGAAIDQVQDVIQRNPTTPVPATLPNVLGLMNLRGYIVTEIDMARTLGIADINGDFAEGYAVVINMNAEMYSLVFEDIGEVIDIMPDEIEKLPFIIQEKWGALSDGVYRQDDKLIVLLNFEGLINHLIFIAAEAA